MRHALCAAILLLASATTALGQTAPSVSYTEATMPTSLLGPEAHLMCLFAAEQDGSTVIARGICYSQDKPFPPPPPPPPPYEPTLHLKDIVGNVSGGVLVLPIWDCVEMVPGVYAASLAMAVNLSSGAGMTILVQDFSAPLTCTGSALYGALTMTELPENHDEDGDGCSDRNELYSDRDPFDPNDCGTGNGSVGGIAEMPSLAVPSTRRTVGVHVAAGVGVFLAGYIVGGALVYMSQRNKRRTR